MNELITIGGHEYSIGRLNALDQFHVARKIAPLVPTLLPILSEIAKGEFAKAIEAIEQEKFNNLVNLDSLVQALEPCMAAFAKMPEEDVNYIVHKCLNVTKRGSALVCRGQSIMFDDLDMGQILPLVVAVIRVSLANFIQGLLTKASAI